MCVKVCAHEWGCVCADAFPPCWVEVTAEKVISQDPSLSDPSWHLPPTPSHPLAPFVLSLRAGSWSVETRSQLCSGGAASLGIRL